VKDLGLRTTCEATVSQNLDLCELIITGQRDFCMRHIATRTVQPKLCQRINDNWYRDMCYGFLAVEMADRTVCESIISASYKERCLAAFNQDVLTPP